jgi:hypothetical protein
MIIGIVIPAIFSVTTNSIIFIYTRRSTRRVQPKNGDSAQARTLSNRDARLLKHMIFLVTAFVCCWAPIYIAMVINFSGTVISPLQMEFFFTIPVFSQLIDIGDLFLYNHELRKYFTSRRQMDQISRSKERPRERL